MRSFRGTGPRGLCRGLCRKHLWEGMAVPRPQGGSAHLPLLLAARPAELHCLLAAASVTTDLLPAGSPPARTSVLLVSPLEIPAA